MTNDGPGRSPTTTITRPIVVDLGKKRRREIAQLKRGDGELPGEVAETMQRLLVELGEEAHGKVVIPVVVLYRRKSKRKRGGLSPLWP